MANDLKRKSLNVSLFPEEFQQFLGEESCAVSSFVHGAKSVLDVGCGEGRAIPIVAPLVGHYTGIDVDDQRLKLASEYRKDYPNVSIYKMDACDLVRRFGAKTHDRSISLFNTIGCVRDPLSVLANMGRTTIDCMFFTVMEKGTLPLREKYYQRLGIDYSIDRSTETICSGVWCESRAYSQQDIENICSLAGLDIVKSGIFANLSRYVIARPRDEAV